MVVFVQDIGTPSQAWKILRRFFSTVLPLLNDLKSVAESIVWARGRYFLVGLRKLGSDLRRAETYCDFCST